jgi:hypothetical protein
MNADKKSAFIYRRSSAFIGGPKDLRLGLVTNFGRSSRLAESKDLLIVRRHTFARVSSL